jgi:endonuclease/exonuclease/phosphatase family metal-dependent hydrolase
VSLRLLSYNILRGGAGREEALSGVINSCDPDIVILQEAIRPSVVKDIADRCGMTQHASSAGHSVAFMSRVDVTRHVWRRVRWARRAYLELITAGGIRIYGVHLSALHSNLTEQRRAYELRSLLRSVDRHQQGLHVITGDFNTLAPGERLDLNRLPPRLRALAWITGKTIRWVTIRLMLEGGYVDAYRQLHESDEGHTFPTWDPQVRLDYAFLPEPFRTSLESCDVVRTPPAQSASDHFPLLTVLNGNT